MIDHPSPNTMNMNPEDRMAQNLKLLCSYSGSISAACRGIGISRQQFTKYLSAKAVPSLRTIRRICDYFGLDDWELMLEPTEFKELIALKPKENDTSNSPLAEFFMLEPDELEKSKENLKRFEGYYYNHFMPRYADRCIVRSLVHIFFDKGQCYLKNIERYDDGSGNAASVVKYQGIIQYSVGRLFLYEREASMRRMSWQSVLYTTDLKTVRYLSGLSMGITSNSKRDIACYRVIFQFLGKDIDKRRALGGCGRYDSDSREIPPFIRNRIRNDVDITDNALMPILVD